VWTWFIGVDSAGSDTSYELKNTGIPSITRRHDFPRQHDEYADNPKKSKTRALIIYLRVHAVVIRSLHSKLRMRSDSSFGDSKLRCDEP
jgi:hypothetical protein